MSYVVRLENVQWQRGQTQILHDINWTVRRGQHWAIVGLNGAGKTSLLNLLTGYAWPTKGSVTVLGERYGAVDVREMRKRIGWVSSSFQERIPPQQYALDLVISGLHASIGLFEDPTKEHIRKALDIMTSLGCRHLADRQYATASHGEKQKLLIARALMADPQLLILDEACNGLDFLSRESLLQSVADLTRRPDAPTLLYVTHHIEEILPELTHTLLLKGGRVFAKGLTTDVLTTESLSALFNTAVNVSWRNGRAWLSL